MKIGAQFFTLRNHCKTLDDLSLSLRKVADMGYSTVQLSAVCEFEADWMKQELDRNGLKCVVTHTPVDKLKGDLKKVCDDHKTFGCHNVGLGMFTFKNDTPEERYAAFLEEYAPVAKGIKEQGLLFMYHNHNAEFRKIGGKTILRKMAEDFAPDEMGFILDTFWIQAGGANPVEYIREFAGRIPCIHLKDFRYNPDEIKNSICAIGDGNINFEAVAAAAADSGVEYMLVEQDNCYDEDPFDALRRSYAYLKSIGLE